MIVLFFESKRFFVVKLKNFRLVQEVNFLRS